MQLLSHVLQKLFNIAVLLLSIIDSKDTPGGSVPHHLLDTRCTVLQPEERGGCDRRGGQGAEEDWEQTHTSTLQVWS